MSVLLVLQLCLNIYFKIEIRERRMGQNPHRQNDISESRWKFVSGLMPMSEAAM